MFVHRRHGQTGEQGYFSKYAINPLKTPFKFSAVFTWPDELDITEFFCSFLPGTYNAPDGILWSPLSSQKKEKN